MNDRQHPYGEVYGYDEYGRPLYRQPDGAGYDYGSYTGPGQSDAPSAPADPGGHPGGHPGGAQQPPHAGLNPYATDGTGYGSPTAGYGDPGGHGAPQHPGHGATGGHHGGYGPGPDTFGPPEGQGYYQPGTGYDAPQAATGYADPAGGYGPTPGYDDPTRHQGPAGPPPGTGHHGPGAPGVPQQYDYSRPPEGDPAGEAPGVHDTAASAAGGTHGRAAAGGTAEQPAVDAGSGTVPGPRAGTPGKGRRDRPQKNAAPADDEFAFVEEDNDDSEEVIDWLKFTESRTERREETKRRGRSRRNLLVIGLVLAVIGGAGFLWATDRVPFLTGPTVEEGTADVAESRDVIILHLRETGGETTSTVLLVANETTGEATTLLLPNALSVSPDAGTTTLGQAVLDEGAASVREAVGALLGADIKGTWRLDTPYLENLVDLVGGVVVDSPTPVPPDADEPTVDAGEQTLDGRSAVTYAVHRADDEPQDAQLQRFGQVMTGVLQKLPTGENGARQVVENLAQIADPSLSEGELGASLAKLAEMAQAGDHTDTLLVVEEDGTISDQVADAVVATVLGGSVSNADVSDSPRVALRDASGDDGAGESATVRLVNGGWVIVDTKPAEPVEESEVRHGSEAAAGAALEVARTLGIPEEQVSQADTPGNADVLVVIGEDFPD
ncbi:LCP family glycopolymer transferase [Streptomyces lonarensis]|uniref:LytR family transcriptional regulator n=1 Tax=Streptomyces lonarensis TaxID=700599 RepID=A0A7X6HXR3_9ACTN|nr:LCP family protein [Streptomyces lonarensis]NJQ04831.1 LytR family transcriptional regulator [Streptomyces lonarensis]